MSEKNLRLILGISGIILGIFFIKINGQQLFDILAFILGALTVLTSLPGLIIAVREKGKLGTIKIILSALGIALGILLMFFAEPAFIIGIGIYMIAFPVFDVIVSQYRSEQFKAELPKIIVGIVLIVIGPGKTVDALIKIIGIILIIISAYSIFMALKNGGREK